MPNIRNTSLSNGQSIYHKSLFDYIYESDDEDVTLKDILTSIDVSIATFEETVELNTVNLNTHLNNKNNPHETTKAHVGLDNVDNTADADKTVKSSMNVLDSVNDTATTFAFSKAGLDTTSWFAVWNSYELRAMSPAKVLSTIGALSVNGGVLNPEKFISREGHSSTWVYGRARALIRQTTYTGYNPILSMKTTSGSWEMGVYENNGFHLSYITDEDFNSYNNRQTVDLLYTDDGTLYIPKVDAELIGNAATATKLKTERTITIGNTSQKFDGSKDIRFELGDVGSGDGTITFEEAASRAGIVSGDSISIAFGKLSKYCSDLEDFVFDNLVGNVQHQLDLGCLRVTKNISENGWYRILSYQTMNAGGAISSAGISLELTLCRNYNYNQAETVVMTIECGYDEQPIAVVHNRLAYHEHDLFKQIRIIWDPVEKIHYLEVYYAGNQINTCSAYMSVKDPYLSNFRSRVHNFEPAVSEFHLVWLYHIPVTKDIVTNGLRKIYTGNINIDDFFDDNHIGSYGHHSGTLTGIPAGLNEIGIWDTFYSIGDGDGKYLKQVYKPYDRNVIAERCRNNGYISPWEIYYPGGQRAITLNRETDFNTIKTPNDYVLPGNYNFKNDPCPNQSGWLTVASTGSDTYQVRKDIYGKHLYCRYCWFNDDESQYSQWIKSQESGDGKVEILPNETNFDDVKENGTWIVNSSHTGGNKPMPDAGWLTVKSHENGDVIQEYIKFYGNASCRRSLTEGTWNPWVGFPILDLGVHDIDASIADAYYFAKSVWEHVKTSITPNPYNDNVVHYVISGCWHEHSNYVANGDLRGSHMFMDIRAASFSYTIYVDHTDTTFNDAVRNYSPYGTILPAGLSSGYVRTGLKSGNSAGNYSTAEGLDNICSGNYSHTEGYIVSASGPMAHAEGRETISEGYSSHAEGSNTKAVSDYSHAEGYRTVASDRGAHAEGISTTASGASSHTEGNSTEASAVYAHAEGFTTKATGDSSHAEGNKCVANGVGSHAEGKTTKAYGAGSHAEGLNSTAGKSDQASATGVGAHAEGYNCKAEGYYSHAEGEGTTTGASGAHAEGGYTRAEGSYSHAGGFNSSAGAPNSFATGLGTDASRQNQMAVGQYNSDPSTPSITRLFIVGNGTSSSARSNALSVSANGTTYGKAAFQTSGADYAEFYEWLDGNVDNEDRRGYFVTFVDDKIRIANPDDEYILGIVSAKPVVIGNSDLDEWHNKFIRDEFGAYIMEKCTIESGDGTEFESMAYVPNPDYDETKEFVPREDRSEWSPIGMLGVLTVRDDGTCKVNSYARVADGGIATHSTDKNDYRVIKRVNDHLVKVVFR